MSGQTAGNHRLEKRDHDRKQQQNDQKDRQAAVRRPEFGKPGWMFF